LAAANDEVKVVVTIKPIHSLVAQLMEGVAEPVLLVDGAASPHSFALRPSQVRAASDAGVFVRVSERLEPFTARLVRSLPDSVATVTLLDAPGVKLLSQRAQLDFESHDHAHDHHDEEAADSADADSHIWLDPANAKAIGAYLSDVLAQRYPQHAQQFADNNKRLAARIDALTEELTAATAPLKGKPFVVFHDAYQYFDRRFDLDAVGSITMSPEVKPSAKRLNELRGKIRALGAVCVFAEPQFQPGLVAAVIEGTSAGSGTLDPEGRMLQPGAGLYAALMRDLVAGLQACLVQHASAENN
jgi:zinc transport system substrate-binding protein